MADLRGGSERVDLGGGYAIVAPGLRGRVERYGVGAAAGTRSMAGAGTDQLQAALARADMNTAAEIEIDAAPVPTAGAVSPLRDARGDDALRLDVPDLGPQTGQVVLAFDEAGTMTWHFPLEDGTIAPATVRGGGGTKRFYIPRRAPPAPAQAPSDRALFGAIGRKILKVIVYPITDLVVAPTAAAIAEKWEAANRAYGVRDFSPANYRDAQVAALAAGDFDRLAAGRALLFVHGTFSTAHAAFGDLPPAVISELGRRYAGRVFAFNHFSMAHDPKQNVERFLAAIAPMTAEALDVDIVCHSRGGLVARALAEGKGVFGLDMDRIRVDRVVFVAAPNHGTPLADPDHMVDMIDRMTNALNLVPSGGVADIFEGILIAVKIIGHGALNGLVGLRSMHPAGDFLKQLNHGGRRDAQYFAIASNYEPTDPGLRALVGQAANALVDRVFEGAENDLVVPELGVYELNGCDSFPIPTDRCLRLPASAGLMHTAMFGNGTVQSQILSWLT